MKNFDTEEVMAVNISAGNGDLHKMNPQIILGSSSDNIAMDNKLPFIDNNARTESVNFTNSDSKLIPVSVENLESQSKLYFGFSLRQLQYMAIFGLMNSFRGVAVLINGPFFPPEAEKRLTTATEIGFIFASFDYTIIFASILYGKYIIKSIGPLLVIKLSILNYGICTVLFGCLALIDEGNHDLFVTLCFLVRILNGAGDAGLYPALFTVFAIEFSNFVSTAVGMIEIFFGIGAILGPIICGALIDIIGYTWVYVSVGLCLIVSGLIACVTTPSLREVTEQEEDVTCKEDTTHKTGYLSFLKIRKVLLVIFSLFVAAASIGFITATLELHMDKFELSSAQTGLVFSTGTGLYMIFSLGWGYVSDNKLMPKNVIIIVGALFIALSFSFLGPLPFLPWETTMWAIYVGYALHGIGIGASIMSAFKHAVDAALEGGFADNAITYGIASGIYTSTFSLGNGVGPSIGGVLYDNVGFRNGTFLIIGLALAVTVLATIESLYEKHKKSQKSTLKQQTSKSF